MGFNLHLIFYNKQRENFYAALLLKCSILVGYIYMKVQTSNSVKLVVHRLLLTHGI